MFHSLIIAGLGAPIAPHLYAIYSDSGWYNMHEALLLLCGPFLRDLVLNLGHLHFLLVRRMPNALGRLRAAAPNVERLVLRAGPALPAKVCIGAVLSLPHLRALDFSTVYGTMLDHIGLIEVLAGLEHLEELVLPDEWDSPTRPYGKYHISPRAGFKNLKKMSVVGGFWTVPLLFAAFPDLRLNELRLVGLKHCCVPPFDELVQSCSDSLLNSLNILHVGYVPRFRPGQYAVKLLLAPPEVVPAISPLFALPNIRAFSVSTEGDCLVQDDDLLDIGEAWPGLASLSIKYNAPAKKAMPVAPTVLGVTSLVNICPNLRSLELPFVVPLRAGYAVEPAYVFTGSRHFPHFASLPGPSDGVDSIDVGRLVDIMWPLFGVLDSPMLLDPYLCSEDWSTVLCAIVHLQNEWERAAV